MSIKILIDMNLSSEWIGLFEQQGWSAVHWSTIGEPTADDATLMRWAVTHGYIVFTHDLDFGAILATTRASASSVIQLRVQDRPVGQASHFCNSPVRALVAARCVNHC